MAMLNQSWFLLASLFLICHPIIFPAFAAEDAPKSCGKKIANDASSNSFEPDPYFKAIHKGDVAAVAQFLDAGRSPNEVEPAILGQTALINAFSSRNPALIRLLLDRGAEVNEHTFAAAVRSGCRECTGELFTRSHFSEFATQFSDIYFVRYAQALLDVWEKYRSAKDNPVSLSAVKDYYNSALKRSRDPMSREPKEIQALLRRMRELGIES